jgi:hypothetical protein
MKHVVATIAVAACGNHDREAPRPPPPFDEVPVALPDGTSDLTLDGSNHLWAIAERDRVVAKIGDFVTPHPTVERVPMRGVPNGVDTEALAWLGDNHFAIGTEGQDTPTASVLFADLGPDALVVTRERVLAPSEVGVALTNNHGAEGICGTGGELIVAIESVGKRSDGTRWAPLVRVHRDDTTSLVRLALTTPTGKISALACVFRPDGSVDILAIERHYEVSRVLQATLAPEATDVTPTVALDLHAFIGEHTNLEGIVRLADGRWILVNDNQGTRVEGPTELFTMHPR